MNEAKDEQRARLVEGNRGLTALTKYFRQLAIIERRIRESMESLETLGFLHRQGEVMQELLLDTETFYTVAHDLLKLVVIFVPPPKLRAFKADQAYKTICTIRSNLVRHAYNKPDGDPYNGYGYCPEYGLALKAGSGGYNDPGYLLNRDAFWKLLVDHRVLTSVTQPAVGDLFLRRFTGKPDADAPAESGEGSILGKTQLSS